METVSARPRPVPWREATLGVACISPVVGVAFMHPVIRGPGFHDYADARTLFGLPNAGDVLSNLPFVWIGIAGLLAARRVTGLPRGLVALFFAGILGIGLGSGVYHAVPGDTTLAFDWLPIVLAISWMVALVAADRVDRRLGRAAAVILPLAAAASVAWWWLGGGTAGGDMRWYAVLQLSFIALVALMIAIYPEGRLDRRDLALGVVCFVAARAFQAGDASILESTSMVSGHTLKHMTAALAAWFVLRAVRRTLGGAS